MLSLAFQAPPAPTPAPASRRSTRIIGAALGGALALALAAAPAGAEPTPAPGAHQPPHMKAAHMKAPRPTVSVQGEGRASVAPDLVTVSVGVTTQAPTAAQAMSDNAAKQAAVIDALKAQGVDAKDLQTQGINLSPVMDHSREGQPPLISGYQAQNIVSARIKDLPKLGPMLDAMVTAGATDVQSVYFSREDDLSARDEARTAAVADARRRAEVMAAAAGQALGPLLSLSEGGVQNGPMPTAMYARDAGGAASTPVETGQILLTSQVTGVWAIVPAGGMPEDAAGDTPTGDAPASADPAAIPPTTPPTTPPADAAPVAPPAQN